MLQNIEMMSKIFNYSALKKLTPVKSFFERDLKK